MRLALSALLIFETCFSVFFFKIEASDFFGFRFRLKSDQTLSALQMACGCMAKKVTNMGLFVCFCLVNHHPRFGKGPLMHYFEVLQLRLLEHPPLM